MRSLMSRLKGLTELLLLTMLLMVGWGSSEAFAQWFSSPGGGSGGFTGRPMITVELYVDGDQTSASVPVNLAGVGPNPSLPYTRTLTAVVRQDGRLFPSSIQLDLAPNLAPGALFDPEDPTQGFRSLPLESTSGLATAFFHASSTPGEVIITASAQDPNTGQTVSASVKITVVDEKRPPTAITFTGPYVNAVIAGESRFGTADGTPIQNGSYSRVVSVVVNDSNGNPTNPNTQINFFLVDGPITGYPSTPGSFFIAGGDGNPVDGQFQFNAVGGNFIVEGVTPFQRLVLGRPVPDLRIIESVLSATSLMVQSSSRSPFPANTSNVPYVIGYAQNAAVLSPSFTDLNGVASTTLTYPVERIGQTAVLVACTADMSVCGTLNTCDVNGANCKSVYLGVTNGTDRTLTVSATSLGPNRSTDVQMCLRDVNFTPLPATEIRYDIGSKGPAKVTVNDVEGTPSKVLTGENGCAVVKIASSGQIPGGQPIELQFTSDYVVEPATVTIKSPGAGKMDGFFTCDFKPDEGTGKCDGTLRLTDDEGSPMAGVLIAVGQVVAPGEFVLTFNPAEGVFGKTDENGQLQVSVEMKSPGAYTFPFQTAVGGTATFTLNATVTAPGVLAVALNGPTAAQLGLPFNAVLQATGGVPPYAWTLTSGSLPPGLGLGANGSISGTPTQEGTFSFAVQAKDKNDLTGFGAFTITVGKQPALTVVLNPTTGAVNVPYSGVVSVTGGTEPYSFALLAGSLPPGLSLNASNGTLSGTPTAVGTLTFSIKVTDSKGATGTGNFSLTISSALPLTVTLSGPAAGTVGAAYNAVLAATGGTPPYTFARTVGNLPPGVTLSANGTLSGTPISGGVFVFTAEATDKNGLKGTTTITLTINSAAAPTIGTTSPLANATPGTFYTTIFTATGGTQPYTWSLEAPSTKPASLTLNATTGALTGTPTTAEVGDYNFIIRVTDANGAFAIASFALTVGSGGDGVANVASIVLLSSSPQLESSGKTPVTLTAVAKDANNNVIEGATVTFAADQNSTLLVLNGGVTDASGTATAELKTLGDYSNRTVTITARSGAASASLIINVVGTKISIAGPTTAVLNANAELSLSLVDSSGAPIPGEVLTVTTSPVNPVSNSAPVTGDDGRATITLTPSALNDQNQIVVTVTGAGVASSLTIAVSPDNFIFVTPLPAPAQLINGTPNIPLNTPQTLRVRWQAGNPPQPVAAGQSITFSATRGTFIGSNTATTNASGEATIQIRADNAGVSLITATTTPGGPSTQIEVLFVSTTPSKMTLQANPTIIGVNLSGSTGEKSTILATIRDANDNPVANRTVNFTLTDSSGGTILPSSGVTDPFGQTSTVYTAGPTPGANNGVRVNAVISGVSSIQCPGQQAVTAGPGVPGQPQGPGPFASCSTSLTVGKKELFIKLGTGNKIEEEGSTQYKQPWNVLVTDSSGGPVANASVDLSVLPTFYYKGYYVKPGDTWIQVITAGPCANEDVNHNGILDPGEDVVTPNGRLDPGNVAAPVVPVDPATGVADSLTDTTGFLLFNVIYAQQYAWWVDVDLVARAQVTGSEALAIDSYRLPILAAALKGEGSPPGQPSPFGQGSTCASETVPALLQIVTTSLPEGFVNVPYSATLVATGGQPPYQWDQDFSIGGLNVLPSGLGFVPATGEIKGTPQAFSAGAYQVGFQVTDSAGDTAEAQLLILINEIKIDQIANTALSGTVGVEYLQTLTATGGVPPYTWSTDEGASPVPGLTLNASTGVLRGTPSDTGGAYPIVYTFVLTVTDVNGSSSSQPIVFTVAK